jgi:integrase/recombinase XerD
LYYSHGIEEFLCEFDVAGRQAKVLTAGQVKAVLGYLGETRNPLRNRVMFLLSMKAGLRAAEIAGVTWGMVMTADGQIGDALDLEDGVAKMRSGRLVPLSRDLRAALIDLYQYRPRRPDQAIIHSERGSRMSAGSVVRWFHDLYSRLGFTGCSSHSGRRTFITQGARRISAVGGSLRDIMELAGHRSLQTTSRYIESDSEAKRRVVDLI